VGVRAWGNQIVVENCHIENATTAIEFGVDGSTAAGGIQFVSSGAIISCGFEQCQTGIDLVAGCTSIFIQGPYGQFYLNKTVGNVPNTDALYGIRMRDGACACCLITGVNFAGGVAVGSNALMYVGKGNPGANNVIACTRVTAGAGGATWSLPVGGGADAAGTVTLISCDALAAWNFADLPSGANRITGMQFDIFDSPTAASGNFAANVTTGGGTNNVRVRWDGSNWKICG
jgi:hypothetical protein